MHARPEIAFQEAQAAGWLSAALEDHGFSVERDVAGLATAFAGTYGSGHPVIAVLSEYDALPELGHACGHNLIGPSAIGAGLCARLAVDALGGTVKVFGTPAEEVGGGKPVMIDAGVFTDVDAVMMFHPYPGEANSAAVGGASLALRGLDITYRGKSAHSAFGPWEGRNALDGVILLFNALNAMRQQLRPDVRLHGIITNGGQAFNITPLTVPDPRPTPPERAASSDFGNVSQVVPAAGFAVATHAPGTNFHTPEFAAGACTDQALAGMLIAVKAMAASIVDLLADPSLLGKARAEFDGK
jgi:amidohydrolase